MTVVDASVAVKWFVQEPDSQLAQRYLVMSGDLAAPDHLMAEVGRALLRRKRSGDVSAAEAKLALVGLPAIVSLVAMEGLATLAFEIADASSVTIYDAFYVALAEQAEDVLVTADRRLLAGVRASLWASRVTALPSVDSQDDLHPGS